MDGCVALLGKDILELNLDTVGLWFRGPRGKDVPLLSPRAKLRHGFDGAQVFCKETWQDQDCTKPGWTFAYFTSKGTFGPICHNLTAPPKQRQENNMGKSIAGGASEDEISDLGARLRQFADPQPRALNTDPKILFLIMGTLYPCFGKP